MIFPELEHHVPGQRQPWPLFFLELAEFYASRSKDPSTKCGAVVVNREKKPVGLGFNGFPAQIEDRPEWYNDREVKYSMTIHAEVNAIDNATASVKDCALFVSLPCCSECAKYIVSKGITEVHYRVPEATGQTDFAERWAEGIRKTEAIFARAGISIVGWDKTHVVRYRRNHSLDRAEPIILAPPPPPRQAPSEQNIMQALALPPATTLCCFP